MLVEKLGEELLGDALEIVRAYCRSVFTRMGMETRPEDRHLQTNTPP
jgi:hypothetical protein